MNIKEKLKIELDNLYKEISICKGVQSVQLWDKVGIIKKQLRGV